MIAEKWVIDLYGIIPPVELGEVGFDETKVKRDAGQFSVQQGAGKKEKIKKNGKGDKKERNAKKRKLKRLTIDQASVMLENRGFKIVKNLQPKPPKFESRSIVRGPGGDTKELSADEIKDLIIDNPRLKEAKDFVSTLYEDVEFEQKHPRDGGQFTTKGGASKKKAQITVERFRNNERIKDFTANKGDLVSLFLSKDKSTVVKIIGISKDSKKVRVRFFNPRTNEVIKGKGMVVSPGELDNLTTGQKEDVQRGKDIKKKKVPKKERLSKIIKKASKEPEGGFSAADLVSPRESEDWVSTLYERKEFDESKVKRDMGKFSRTQGAGKREKGEKVDRAKREKGNGRSGGQKTSDRAFRVSAVIKKLEGEDKLQAHEQAAQIHSKASRRLAKEGNMELANWHKGIGLAHQNAIRISEDKAFAKTALGSMVNKAIDASDKVQGLFNEAVENFPRNRKDLVKEINNAVLINKQVAKEAFSLGESGIVKLHKSLNKVLGRFERAAFKASRQKEAKKRIKEFVKVKPKRLTMEDLVGKKPKKEKLAAKEKKKKKKKEEAATPSFKGIDPEQAAKGLSALQGFGKRKSQEAIALAMNKFEAEGRKPKDLQELIIAANKLFISRKLVSESEQNLAKLVNLVEESLLEIRA